MLKRFVSLFVALSLVICTVGCGDKAKVEKKDTVTTPGGSTTTTDSHTVESSGKNPPANDKGETGK